MIKKITASKSEKIILSFLILLGIFTLIFYISVKDKCSFVKNYNTADIFFENPKNIIVLNTQCGNVIIELYPNVSPKSVKRFKTLIKLGAYNGVAFHRVIKKKLVQAGDLEYGKKK